MEENIVVEPIDEVTEAVAETPEDTGGDTSSPVVGGDTIVNVLPSADIVSRSVVINDYEVGADSGLSGIVNAVFGEYQPRTQTVTEVYSDGSTTTYTEVVGGLAGLDWYWFGGVLVFSIVLFSFFKLLGTVFKGR